MPTQYKKRWDCRCSTSPRSSTTFIRPWCEIPSRACIEQCNSSYDCPAANQGKRSFLKITVRPVRSRVGPQAAPRQSEESTIYARIHAAIVERRILPGVRLVE